MVKYLIPALFVLAFNASADCYYTSSTMSVVQGKVDGIDHVYRMYGQGRCTVTGRVLYSGQWHSFSGVATNATREPDELCLDAMEMGVRDFLLKRNNKRSDAVQQMVCSDMPEKKTRPVQKGEIINVSEVQPHPHRRPFLYDGNECRWFVEAVPGKYGNLETSNGVICKVNRLNDDKWLVADKNLD